MVPVEGDKLQRRVAHYWLEHLRLWQDRGQVGEKKKSKFTILPRPSAIAEIETTCDVTFCHSWRFLKRFWIVFVGILSEDYQNVYEYNHRILRKQFSKIFFDCS
jgi:hypothetical protein